MLIVASLKYLIFVTISLCDDVFDVNHVHSSGSRSIDCDTWPHPLTGTRGSRFTNRRTDRAHSQTALNYFEYNRNSLTLCLRSVLQCRPEHTEHLNTKIAKQYYSNKKYNATLSVTQSNIPFPK